MERFYTRRKVSGSYHYFKAGRAVGHTATIARINALAIPPAWREVQIAIDPRRKVQATGRDTAGRRQAIYHPEYRARQDKAKFARILNFATRLPALRRQVDRDLKRRSLSKDKVLAIIVRLIDEAYFRVGNQTYAREHGSYGITTMRSKHVDVTTTSVTFDFIGKSGQHHVQTISDRQIARSIKQLDELPGYDLFRYIDETGDSHPLTAHHVNEYIKRYMGDDFTAKDFRTWGGTMLAVSNLAIEQRAETETARKRSVSHVVKMVAAQLGNTPAVARSSYIDPRVVDAYMATNAIAEVYATMHAMKPQSHLKNEERAVIKLLGSVK